MYDLAVIKLSSGCYIDSREVAGVIGKRHDHLLRDIRNYEEIIKRRGLPKVGASDFFLESSFINAQNKEMPCYLLSKMGCEMVANKLTGEKGILFTAAYVAKFNEMEANDRAATTALRAPRLGEYNAAARLIVRAMQNMGATAEQIIGFLKGVYEPLGFSVEDDELADIPRMYTAKQIAKMLGIYSITGNPHPQAVSAILNENIFISDTNKTVVTMDYGDHIGVSAQYDDYAVRAVQDWLIEYGYPGEIYGFERTYHVLYKN